LARRLASAVLSIRLCVSVCEHRYFHDTSIAQKHKLIWALIETSNLALNDIYNLAFQSKKYYDLKLDDFSIAVVSFLKSESSR
jgi:hypothetical protein